MADKLHQYMATDSGKRTILNPDGSKPILEICNTPEECAKEVQSRFRQHVKFFLQSEDVMGEFIAIQKDAETLLQKTSEQVSKLEMENKRICQGINDFASTGATLGMTYVILQDIAISMSFKTLSLALPMLAAASLFFYAAAFTLNFLWKSNRRDENLKAIDLVYYECMSSVRQIVSEQLKNNVATLLTKLIEKVTVNKLPRQIKAMEDTIQQLVTSRNKIIANRGLLLNLASKIDGMQKNVCKMQRDLLTNYLLREEQTSSDRAT